MPTETARQTSLSIAAASSEELAALLALLAEAGLPTAGVAAHLDAALVVRDGDRLLGCVALELYGDEALLRSLAVAPTARGQGLGERLTAAALELAETRGARRVWLLTTTAQKFFPRFGFLEVTRDELPAALAASEELRGACPASAVVMGLGLDEHDAP
ncbi:MAG: arsenic resistance N-acetyltransferase ArsN2 [Thermoanaerobaculia bacterium]|nr:arsenic resistance N-acetyltransferase ArsN2 [Thermoanaerobaculia bacterium]